MTLLAPIALTLWLATAVAVLALCRLAKHGDEVQLARQPAPAPTRHRLPRLRGAHASERPLARRGR